MPRLRSYWNSKATALMTAEQATATAERYALWQHDKDLNNKAARNAASVERARQWAKDHPEEHKERQRKAREVRKARRMADPEYRAKHKSQKKKHKESYRTNPLNRRAIRAGHLRPKGWTVERYDHVLVEQKNCCAICLEIFLKTPSADHKHSIPPTPRGLLCNNCNAGLGFLKDSPELCEAAAAYLRKFL